jgi:hypothetical protein
LKYLTGEKKKFTATYLVGKHKMVAKGTGREIRKSRPEKARNWTIRANKM